MRRGNGDGIVGGAAVDDDDIEPEAVVSGRQRVERRAERRTRVQRRYDDPDRRLPGIHGARPGQLAATGDGRDCTSRSAPNTPIAIAVQAAPTNIGAAVLPLKSRAQPAITGTVVSPT